MNTKLKFTLTQLSALIPAITGMSIALLYFRTFVMTDGKPDGFPFLQFGIFVFIMMASIFTLVKVWAWILVSINILTRDEAKGYPYSKPWEKRKL